MMLTLGAALLGSLLGTIQTDTTIVVPAGSRLDVHQMAGEIVIRTWNRNEVRVQAEHGSRERIIVRNEGSIVTVEADSRRPGPQIVDYVITVPARMDLSLGGLNVSIDVEGTQGNVDARTVNGPIRVVGGSGRLNLEAVNGAVQVENARGNVNATAINGRLTLRNVQGAIDAETVSGRIILEGVQSSNVIASSVSGQIVYDGAIANGGRYSFSTHSGSILLGLPRNINATVTLAQVTGSFSSTIPVLASAGTTRGRRQSVTLGTGEAVIEAETFSGGIRIVEQGQALR